MTRPGLSRRNFFAAASGALATVTLPEWLDRDALAGTVHIRHDAHSENGKEALRSYRRGVAAMKALPPANPHSWVYQANIHWALSMEDLHETFGNPAASPELQLGKDTASILWWSCVHDLSGNFLPWHRMYLLFFERIVRKMSMDPDFTLPYWNYSDPAKRALPIEFREPINGSTDNNSLFFVERNLGINELTSPLQLAAADVAIDAALSAKDYHSKDLERGFEAALEVPHASVHGAIGTVNGMANTPRAARDPIFFLHHANVDRLWESWLTEPMRVNPSGAPWLDFERQFFDENGTIVRVQTRDVAKSLYQLGYRYDRLERPTPSLVLMTSENPMPYANSPATCNPSQSSLSLVSERNRACISLGASLFSPGDADAIKRRKYYLLLSGVDAQYAPGTTFRIFLNLPEGSIPDNTDLFYVGQLSLFGRTQGDTPSIRDHSSHHSATSVPPFPITNLVKGQIAVGIWNSERFIVEMIPTYPANLDPKARTVVGSVHIIEVQ